MKRFRHRPMRVRFAIIAIVGMLWSQLVLAVNPLCLMATTASSEMVVGEAVDVHGCPHPQTPTTDDVLCAVHCTQGDLSNDVARVPALPALPPPEPVAIASFVFLLPGASTHPGMPPPVSWHRPTAHPAALLLI
jgi:hypothetical protein